MNKAMQIAVALALVTVVAGSGCCGSWSDDDAKMDTYCGVAVDTCTNLFCCLPAMCGAMEFTHACPSGEEYDVALATTSALNSTYADTCCKTAVQKTCAVLRGEEDEPNFRTCPDDTFYNTSLSTISAYSYDFAADCCQAAETCGDISTQSCDDEYKEYNESKATTAFVGEFADTCCSETPMCSKSADVGYSDIQFGPGFWSCMSLSVKTGEQCLSTGCDANTCCDWQVSQCGYYKDSCANGTYYGPTDGDTAGASTNAGATYFQDVCCKTKATCQNYTIVDTTCSSNTDNTGTDTDDSGALRTSPAFAVYAAFSAIVVSLF